MRKIIRNFSFFTAFLVIFAQDITLPLQINNQKFNIEIPRSGPPLSLAREICETNNLVPVGDEECLTLISSEIHRLQSVEMASKGTSPVPPYYNLGSYYARAQRLENRLTSSGHLVTEGHIGMIPEKVDFLFRLAASPLVRNIVQVGMNAGHSALLFLEANRDARVVSIDVGLHDYTFFAAQLLREWYGERHSLILQSSQDAFQAALKTRWGNSSDPENLPSPLGHVKNQVDLILIDGDHGYQGALEDLLFGCEVLAHTNRSDRGEQVDASGMQGGGNTATLPQRRHRDTLVIMDDVGRGCHTSPVDGMYSSNSCEATAAWNEALRIAREGAEGPRGSNVGSNGSRDPAVFGGVASQLEQLESVTDGRISGLVVGVCASPE